jgi:hypothetical protein
VKERKVLRRLPALRKPQGVAYHAATSTLYVADAGDGSVRLFQGPDFMTRVRKSMPLRISAQKAASSCA